MEASKQTKKVKKTDFLTSPTQGSELAVKYKAACSKRALIKMIPGPNSLKLKTSKRAS